MSLTYLRRAVAEPEEELVGPMPQHEWESTRLRFQKPSGEWGEFMDLRGPPGKDGLDALSPEVRGFRLKVIRDANGDMDEIVVIPN